jgi:hypothetical protein
VRCEPDGYALREIPCPADENAGLRDDAGRIIPLNFQTAPVPKSLLHSLPPDILNGCKRLVINI